MSGKNFNMERQELPTIFIGGLPSEEVDENVSEKSSVNKAPLQVDDKTIQQKEVSTPVELENKESTDVNKSNSVLVNIYKALAKMNVVESPEVITIDDSGTTQTVDEFLTSEESLIKLIEHSTKHSSESYVNTDGLSDIQKKSIEAIMNNVPLNTVLESYFHAKSVIDEIDLDTVEGQRLAVTEFYRKKGLQDSEIVALLRGYEAEGTLATEAITKYEGLLEMDKEAINASNKAAIEKKDKIKKDLENHTTLVRNSLKELGLSEHKARMLTQKYLSIPASGGVIGMWTIFEQNIKNPSTMAELMLYLENPTEFKQTITAQAVNTEKIDAVKKSVDSQAAKRGITIISAANNVKPQVIKNVDDTKIQENNVETSKVDIVEKSDGEGNVKIEWIDK